MNPARELQTLCIFGWDTIVCSEWSWWKPPWRGSESVLVTINTLKCGTFLCADFIFHTITDEPGLAWQRCSWALKRLKFWRENPSSWFRAAGPSNADLSVWAPAIWNVTPMTRAGLTSHARLVISLQNFFLSLFFFSTLKTRRQPLNDFSVCSVVWPLLSHTEAAA